MTSSTRRTSDATERDGHKRFRRIRALREHIRAQPHADLIYRVTVGLIGSVVVIVGLVLVPFPGPGWFIVICGLIVLSTEFAWARRLLAYVKAKLLTWTHWLGAQPWPLRIGLVAASCALAGTVTYCMLLWLGVPGWVPDDWVTWLPGF